MPTGWKEVKFTGLKAIGDFTVDLSWSDRKPVEAVITSNQGQPLTIRNSELKNAVIYVNGEQYTPETAVDDIVTLTTEPGDVVRVDFDGKVSIVDIADEASEMDFSVSGRTVTVIGSNVTAVKVYDLQGRLEAAVSGCAVVVPAECGNMVLVSATDANGRTESRKVALK